MPLVKGMFQRDRHFSKGNGALLVIVDGNGGYWDRKIVDETILVALEHYGMPYRLFDLASRTSRCRGPIGLCGHYPRPGSCGRKLDRG